VLKLIAKPGLRRVTRYLRENVRRNVRLYLTVRRTRQLNERGSAFLRGGANSGSYRMGISQSALACRLAYATLASSISRSRSMYAVGYSIRLFGGSSCDIGPFQMSDPLKVHSERTPVLVGFSLLPNWPQLFPYRARARPMHRCWFTHSFGIGTREATEQIASDSRIYSRDSETYIPKRLFLSLG
jgi:hypothetical protein